MGGPLRQGKCHVGTDNLLAENMQFNSGTSTTRVVIHSIFILGPSDGGKLPLAIEI